MDFWKQSFKILLLTANEFALRNGAGVTSVDQSFRPSGQIPMRFRPQAVRYHAVGSGAAYAELWQIRPFAGAD